MRGVTIRKDLEVTQKEIIEIEETNTGVIRLYLEGTFYKAYERSAFAFCTRVKDYRVLRKESKTLGRDILYVGFPMSALDKTLGNAMTRKVSDTALDIVLSYPMNENEFLQWRDSQEVEQASRALLSPYTKVREKSPVYKTAYDILTQVILISRSIDEALPFYDELAFLLQLMKDRREVSLNSFALLSEQIQSVSKQLSFLRRKVTDPVTGEPD